MTALFRKPTLLSWPDEGIGPYAKIAGLPVGEGLAPPVIVPHPAFAGRWVHRPLRTSPYLRQPMAQATFSCPCGAIHLASPTALCEANKKSVPSARSFCLSVVTPRLLTTRGFPPTRTRNRTLGSRFLALASVHPRCSPRLGRFLVSRLACSRRAASLRLGLEKEPLVLGFSPSLRSIRAVRDGSDASNHII